MLALDFEAEQRAVAGEGPAGLERGLERRRAQLAASVEEHAVHADGPAQRGVIGHRVGARAGRQAVAEVEQAVPDAGGRLVVGETDDLDIIDLAVGDVGGELVGERLLLGGIDDRVERMDVADQRALGVGEVGDGAIVGKGAGERAVLIGRETGRQIVIGKAEQAEMAPVAGVIFLAMQ